MSTTGQLRPLDACPECRGRLDHDAHHAEHVCRDCGLVVPAHLEDATQGDGRAAPPPPALALPARRVLGPGTGRPRVPKALLRARRELNRLADVLRAPDHAVEQAYRNFRQLHRAGATQGRRLEVSAAACLLEALRDAGVPRTLRETAQAADVRPQDVVRAQRALAEATRGRVLPPRPVRFLWAYAGRADLPPTTVAEAARLLQNPPDRAALSSRRPEPLAAAALVLAARRLEVRHSLARTAEAAGVSRQAVYDALGALGERAPPNAPDEPRPAATGRQAA